MISLQKLFGKDDKFFDLLEASAEEARLSVKALNQILSRPSVTPNLEDFHKAKETDKRITGQMKEEEIGKDTNRHLIVTLSSFDCHSQPLIVPTTLSHAYSL